MDKVRSVSENGAVTASFTYDVDGQIATAKTHATGKQESFLWDGLALIHRGGTSYINEPYVTGGNPILAEDKVLFNDMLGTTLGSHSDEGYTPVRMTAFGESDNADAFFTGKPLVGELGYTFLFRNYRPEQGKWQTADPLGYPDGWNNLAYVNNGVTMAIDWLGGEIILSDKSFNAATLFTSRFVPNSETPNWFVNQGNTNVSYYVTADIKKDKNYEWTAFHINLIITSYNGQIVQIKKPQSFLNEAKMSAVAVAIRLAIIDQRIGTAVPDALKVLVLDDLMISLDMGNRDKLMDLLLDDFAKILLIIKLNSVNKMKNG